jgi:hypothetical protein
LEIDCVAFRSDWIIEGKAIIREGLVNLLMSFEPISRFRFLQWGKHFAHPCKELFLFLVFERSKGAFDFLSRDKG